ncbi:MAG TPA: beta-ketoacyl synthase N-terminal-like domain-containing protein [Streptosporangiaceae bacterium]|nr:beta-ketoacyl synthase N-terminal-like domain-containing protein [Streptosporangiaceae bacterium]
MPDSKPGDRDPADVVITGMGVTSAFGRGEGPLLDGVLSGESAFGQATRFPTSRCRVGVAAQLPGSPDLAAELAAVIDDARGSAGLDPADSGDELLLALHTDQAAARNPAAGDVLGDVPARIAALAGLPPPARIYTTACVAASTAVADAAASIRAGRATRVIVAAGYLVDADSFWLFDAGRTLAADGQARPFSAGRQGLLLGDGLAAVVLEAAGAARTRGATVLARLAGWGRAGDAYHVCQPRPDGTGLARAIAAALNRAQVGRADIGYLNASGSGTSFADAAESAAIHLAFGDHADSIPVSSTKSAHGHALEASALVELVVTVLAMRAGLLPVNAGFLAHDPACRLDLVLAAPRETRARHALSLNAAFGGANTALLVEAT